jgi:hypothetical protein
MTKLALELGGGLKGLPIRSSKESVRTFFGAGHEPFKRTPDCISADYWPDRGVFAYYDSANLLEALEFSDHDGPTLDETCLTTAVLGEAIERLRSFDPDLCVEPDGATSTKLGIGVWSSTGELDQPVTSAITFGPGYYD